MDCPKLQYLDLLRVRSECVDRSSFLSDLTLPLKELHVAWSSLTAHDFAALLAGSRHSLERLCVSIIRARLSCDQVADLLRPLTNLQELVIYVDKNGREDREFLSGGCERILAAVSRCSIKRLSIVYERPQKISASLVPILQAARKSRSAHVHARL
jgi:hypothetical protein